jgi:DUF1365 family protein
VTAVYDTTVHHTRRSPLRHSFTYRSRSWLVDLDALPRKGFEARDHVGDPDRSLRENVDALLAAQGLACTQVLMLASPRRLGHVFNPLSVHWCLDADGRLVATVAEVHNTYGGKHAYVLPAGTDAVDKAFYVSPFHEVDGRYELDLPRPDAFVRLTVTYHRAGAEPFVASVRGTRLDRHRVDLRDLLATRLVALRIRRQGLRLWSRRLPVVPRSLQPQEIS